MQADNNQLEKLQGSGGGYKMVVLVVVTKLQGNFGIFPLGR